jgi:hypothetical protein
VLSPGGPGRSRPALGCGGRPLVVDRDAARPGPAGEQVDAGGPDGQVIGGAAVREPYVLGDLSGRGIERPQDLRGAASALRRRSPAGHARGGGGHDPEWIDAPGSPELSDGGGRGGPRPISLAGRSEPGSYWPIARSDMGSCGYAKSPGAGTTQDRKTTVRSITKLTAVPKPCDSTQARVIRHELSGRTASAAAFTPMITKNVVP